MEMTEMQRTTLIRFNETLNKIFIRAGIITILGTLNVLTESRSEVLVVHV